MLRPGCDAIFHARSKDLGKWEVYSGEDRWDATMNPNLWVPVITADNKNSGIEIIITSDEYCMSRFLRVFANS